MSNTKSQRGNSPTTRMPAAFSTTPQIQTAVVRSGRSVFSVLFVSVLLATLLLSTNRQIAAQSTSRWNTSLPFWQNTTAWSPLGVPGPTATALFDINAIDTVVWNNATADRTAGRLEVVAGIYTFLNSTASPFQLSLNSNGSSSFRVSEANTTVNLNGLHINLTASNALIEDGATLNVGTGAVGVVGKITSSGFLRNDGTLNILNGARIINSSASIASTPSSSGETTLTGAGSLWDLGSLSVGDRGVGTLTVEDGCAVTCGSPSVSSVIGAQGGSNGTTTVTGVALWIVNNQLAIGGAGEGTLIVENNGQVVAVSSAIGSLQGSIGTATVTGAGSLWNTVDDLLVGSFGMGTLNVENGGEVNAETGIIGSMGGSSGSATVSGDNSQWNTELSLVVGLNGDGTLQVENGGFVSNLEAFIASRVTSTGSAMVTGSGSLWEIDNIHVGQFGTGTLVVENGGEVSTQSSFIGEQSGSFGSATVTGADSTWTGFANLEIGKFGNGIINVENGGTLRMGFSIIAGSRPNSQGSVMASGLNTQLNTFKLTVGEEGEGVLVVENEAIALIHRLRIGEAAGSSGLMTVRTGGSVFASEDAVIGQAGIGTLTIDSGGSVTVDNETFLFPGGEVNLGVGTFTSDSISLNGGGSFNFNDGVLHVGTYLGDLVNEGGTLAPGQSAGSTSIIGSYTQEPTGKLEIELGGPLVNTQFDFVNISQDAILDGTLELALIDGFLPAQGQTFTILNAGGIFGFFSNVTDNQRLETIGGEGSFLVRYGVTSLNPNQVILSEFEPTPIFGESLLVTRGNHVSGSLVELADSDNADVSIRRAANDIQSRTEFVVKGFSPTVTPANMTFILEGAVFARSNVVQSIELFNYATATWELVDSRNAARSPAPDLVVTVVATGDLSRFVEAGTRCIEARIRYQSDNPRQNFASNTDRAVWIIN